MQITELRIRKVEDEGKLRAYVTVTFDNCFVVHNVKIIEGKSGLFIAMPSRKTANGDTVYVYNGLIASVGEEVWLLIDKAKFVNCIHNSVGLLNSLAKVVTKEDGSTEIVYNTKEVANRLGWKVIGSKSEVENHCLNME